MINLVGKRYIFLLVSLLVIIPGLVAIFAGGLKPGIDFTGGTRWEVKPLDEQANSTEKFKSALAKIGYGDALVKGGTLQSGNIITSTIIMDLKGDVKGDEKAKIENQLVEDHLVAGERITETISLTPTATVPPAATTMITGTSTITPSGTLTATGTVTATGTTTDTTGSTTPQAPPTITQSRFRILQSSELDFISIGPTIGQELVGRAILAVLAASTAILIYLTVVFRRVPNAFRYGVCAIVALLHDVLVVLGIFAILGFVIGIEIDALFVTAMLTVIGFSVHDTIVVFDRVRENIMKRRFERFEDVVNYSLVQTLARSINTSITVLLTLFALYLFGGASIRNFVLALLIGIISGTYSSIFNASMLLVIWENREWGRLFGRSPSPTPGTRSAAMR
jgi:preprotein translocase subunit SecF